MALTIFLLLHTQKIIDIKLTLNKLIFYQRLGIISDSFNMNYLDILPDDVMSVIWKHMFDNVLKELQKTKGFAEHHKYLPDYFDVRCGWCDYEMVDEYEKNRYINNNGHTLYDVTISIIDLCYQDEKGCKCCHHIDCFIEFCNENELETCPRCRKMLLFTWDD
jgi:hypothetical protein